VGICAGVASLATNTVELRRSSHPKRGSAASRSPNVCLGGWVTEDCICRHCLSRIHRSETACRRHSPFARCRPSRAIKYHWKTYNSGASERCRVLLWGHSARDHETKQLLLAGRHIGTILYRNLRPVRTHQKPYRCCDWAKGDGHSARYIYCGTGRTSGMEKGL
jgi:hypothetical protein